MTTLVQTRSQVLMVGIGVLLLAASAQIQIPLQPVPITLQTLAVMVLGLCFPKREAMQAVITYVLLGVAGLPLLAGPFAWARLGYLLGFILAVWSMTSVRERVLNKSFWALWWITLLGGLCIYTLGVGWLALSLGLKQAILLGFMPFILPGLVKSVMLAGIVKFLRS